MKPKLIFGDPDVERSKELNRSFQGHPQLIARELKTPDLMRLDDIDGIYLSVMAAERWGARPIVHEAQVLETTPADRDIGWPPFIIAGVAETADDPRDPQFELRLIVLAVLRAVEEFNVTAKRAIETIAFGPEWTGIKRLAPQQAAEVIRAAYDDA